MDNNFLFLCVLQVTLANESIVLYMCEGKVLMDKGRSCIWQYQLSFPCKLWNHKNEFGNV